MTPLTLQRFVLSLIADMARPLRFIVLLLVSI